MEQIRKARGHVLRAGFIERLERICAASAEKIDAVIQSLGPNASHDIKYIHSESNSEVEV